MDACTLSKQEMVGRCEGFWVVEVLAERKPGPTTSLRDSRE